MKWMYCDGLKEYEGASGTHYKWLAKIYIQFLYYVYLMMYMYEYFFSSSYNNKLYYPFRLDGSSATNLRYVFLTADVSCCHSFHFSMSNILRFIISFDTTNSHHKNKNTAVSRYSFLIASIFSFFIVIIISIRNTQTFVSVKRRRREKSIFSSSDQF